MDQPDDNVVPIRRRSAADTDVDSGDSPATGDALPPLRDVIGEVLRDERHRQQRTLTDVARQAAVSVPYLSEIERGRKEVSSDVLDAITRSLDIDLADVLERSLDRLRVRAQRNLSIELLLAA